MANAKKTDVKDLAFGEAFAELEEITETFEQEDVDLEEGLKRFERGLKLANLCREKLEEVENKVEEMKETHQPSKNSQEE